MPIPCDKHRVLVVDDEDVIRRLFKMVLSWELPDTEIDMAANGREALEAFAAHHQAVLLMDLHMPVMDGQSAFLEIEKRCGREDWEMPKVVFCTGFAPPSTVRDIVAHDVAHTLLCKPVSNETLVDAVRQRLRLANQPL